MSKDNDKTVQSITPKDPSQVKVRAELLYRSMGKRVYLDLTLGVYKDMFHSKYVIGQGVAILPYRGEDTHGIPFSVELGNELVSMTAETDEDDEDEEEEDDE